MAPTLQDDDELGHIDLNQVADSSCIKGDLKLEVPNGMPAAPAPAKVL